MKFAKELDEDAILEWKVNYFDYKLAKKKLGAVSRANRTVETGSHSRTTPGSSRDVRAATFLGRSVKDRPAVDENRTQRSGWSRSKSDAHPIAAQNGGNRPEAASQPLAISERSPLRPILAQTDGSGSVQHPMVSYGSIIGSPPNSPALRLKRASTLELPETAIALDDTLERVSSIGAQNSDVDSLRLALTNSSTTNHGHQAPPTQLAHRGNAYTIQSPVDVSSRAGEPGFAGPSTGTIRRTNSVPSGRPFVKRMWSTKGAKQGRSPGEMDDIALEAYQEFDFRKAEFFLFLEKELAKIESFYKAKEDEAAETLVRLREQLHVMRSYRLQEILLNDQKHNHAAIRGLSHLVSNLAEDRPSDRPRVSLEENGDASRTQSLSRSRLVRPLVKSLDIATEALDKIRFGHVGKTSEAMGDLGTPILPGHWQPDPAHRDYSRKPIKDVPYRSAKRKMKLALAEYYRGLELLKAYALLNRKAFRKINKKYDKAIRARKKMVFVEEKINKAYFVTSDAVDKMIEQLEDLYARYFERGNRKVAVSKLRAKIAKAGEHSGSIARTCALAGAGTVLSLQAIVYSAQDLFNMNDPVRVVQAEYLLQLYAGYFLILLLAALFCLDAGVFKKYKVNYQFIFELNARNSLDWLQLCEIPAWLLFMLSLAMWLNFAHVGGDTMYLYWFVVLIAASVAFLFAPAPIIYHRTRAWVLYSIWRLLAAGIYSVEFRDFFLGDMFCSLTYSMGNIELFACLYARHWNGEEMCNSSHSRTLGFLSTLPGIWRALQCLRRFWDTRNAFPHLANCAKYLCTILMYMSLSLYRINKIPELKALFIACATVNAVYTSFWDIFMDWSLGDMGHFGLRSRLVYKKHVWAYYIALVLDPAIRFNWVFYAIYTQDLQHSTIVAFFVALSEVIRRGLWVLFRVENEQCTNIANARASRTVTLPYDLATPTSVDHLLGTDQNGRARPANERSSTITEEAGQEAQVASSAVQKLSHIMESGTVKSAPGSDPLVAKADDSAKPSPASNNNSPRGVLRRAGNPGRRRSSAAPFNLLGVRFWNSNAMEPQTVHSDADADAETGAVNGSTVSANQASDKPLHRTDTASSGAAKSSLQRIGDTMRSAHAQDYEKRKKPIGDSSSESSGEEDEEENEE